MFLARGTTRVVMMLFLQVLATAVAMAILFMYCFSNCDFVGTWQHFLMFLGFKNIFVGSLHSNPMATLSFCFFYLCINIFVGSLYSKPLHG